MKHELPRLPYSMDAFEPSLSKESFTYHYGKHHKAYVDKVNKLVEGTDSENATLKDMILKSGGKLFNNAAQAWNHSFFWKCLSPKKTKMSNEFEEAFRLAFPSDEGFQQEFVTQGVNAFGSGWIWLTCDQDRRIRLETTHDADNPLRRDRRPLLTCDLWEHAYYIDYRNERAKFLQTFLKIVNWNFVSENFESKEVFKAEEESHRRSA